MEPAQTWKGHRVHVIRRYWMRTDGAMWATVLDRCGAGAVHCSMDGQTYSVRLSDVR